MNTLLLFSFITLFSLQSFAQTGIYEYQNKSTKEDIELNLRRDGVFLYTYGKEWTNCVTMGKWKPLGHGKVLLNSDYQLTDYTVEEIEEPNQKGIHLIIQGKSKGQSPTSISKIFLNSNESTLFEQDGEAGLKMLAEHHKMMAGGSLATKDSLRKADPPRFYKYPSKKDIKTISLFFDNKEIIVEIKNPKANKIIITTAFSPNASYHYLKDVEFIQHDKFIYEAGSSIKLKKKKN